MGNNTSNQKKDLLLERLTKCLEVFEAQQETGEFTVPPRQEFLQTIRDAIDMNKRGTND